MKQFGHSSSSVGLVLCSLSFKLSQVSGKENLPAVQEMQVRSLGGIQGRSPGREHGNPLQLCQENPMDRAAWWAVVYRVTKSWTQLKRLSTRIRT